MFYLDNLQISSILGKNSIKILFLFEIESFQKAQTIKLFHFELNKCSAQFKA